MKRPTDDQYINAARAMISRPALSLNQDEIEIGSLEDKHVMVSQNNEGGAWVKAWVYVYDTDISVEELVPGLRF